LVEGTYDGFEHVVVETADGCRLNAYECGPAGAPSVVIINPIGVPIVISTRLARALAETHRVICWEQRGYGVGAAEFGAIAHNFTAFLGDVRDVVTQRAKSPCVLIGVCSGAALAIRAVTTKLVDVSRLVLVSPAVRFTDGYVQSLYDLAVVPHLRAVGDGNRKLAADMLEMRAAGLADGAPAARSSDEAIVEAADTASLESLETLTVYGQVVKTFTDERLDDDIRRLRQRVAVLAAADDKVVSIKTVRQLCKALPDAELQEFANGGHYMVFLRPDVVDRIRRIVGSSA
jgi:pimeloyl-ACP methyl ester carboxylesterase